MQFQELKIIPEILNALKREDYTEPTPIQEQAIPVVLSGRDLLGCAQTGTGKTAAFAIPTLQLLAQTKSGADRQRPIRSLILTPTRELAIQIYESFSAYGRYMKLRTTVVYGGVSQKGQEDNLSRGVDILVATPGRLLDLMDQSLIDLKDIEILILDEADRMLDMGFIHDVRKIVARTPGEKQTLLFSATMPDDIARLSNEWLKKPARVSVTPVSSTVESTEQYICFVDKGNKRNLLTHILQDDAITSALVFSRTKHGANQIAKHLAANDIPALAIHGNKSQSARQNALNAFKNRELRVLVATDIAARGIDIEELSHVINVDLPEVPETYVHRIGRTGRAGLSGIAISFCNIDEKPYLAAIEKLIRKPLTEIAEHPYPLVNFVPSEPAQKQGRNRGGRQSKPRQSNPAPRDRNQSGRGRQTVARATQTRHF
ncbi:MAG TPA: DEAD/DEAH box helicase [Clostridiaceae bacterium]|nr:DEAD/DEAH box helicase [Clostridiaceae bacterium]